VTVAAEAPELVQLENRGHDLRGLRRARERRLNRLDGVDASVNYATERRRRLADALASGDAGAAEEKSRELLAAVQRFARTR